MAEAYFFTHLMEYLKNRSTFPPQWNTSYEYEQYWLNKFIVFNGFYYYFLAIKNTSQQSILFPYLRW